MKFRISQAQGKNFRTILLLIGTMVLGLRLSAQNVAVTDVDGYNPHTSAMLDVNSTSKGLLLPRVTTAQMNAIATPAAGLMVYNTSIGAIYLYNGSSWQNLLSFGVSALTAPDGSPSNALVVDNNGNIGINQPVPAALLHLKGNGTNPDNYLRMEANSGGYFGNIFYDAQGMKFRTRNNGSGYYFQEDGGITNMIIQDNGWVGIGNAVPWGKLEVKGDASMSADSAIFVVRNRNGFPVFAVYDGGVRIYIDDAPGVGKGGKGGFAVSGRSTAKTVGVLNDIFVLSPDSARFYLEPAAKGGKGGFAVGGRSPNKGTPTNFLDLTPQNYFIGHESGLFTTGLYNVFMGYQSGKQNSTGNYNSYVGYQSGTANTSGSYNSFFGYQSGLANTTGSLNTFIGNLSGKANVDGTANTTMGTGAALNMIGGNYNTILGALAGQSYKKGNNNIFIGFNAAGQGDFTALSAGGDNNIVIGVSAANKINTGADNIIVGSFAGWANTSGLSNVILGKDAGRNNTTGSYNLFIGHQSGYSNTSSGYNVFLGYQSGYLNNGGDYNAFLGYQSGYNNTTGDYNTLIGYQAGFTNSGSGYITAIGYQAGYSLANWQAGTYVGYQAGLYNTGRQNVFIGANAGDKVSTGQDNVFVGAGTGSYAQWEDYRSTGSSNVFVGYYAGFRPYAGANNVYLGFNSGYNCAGSGNVFLGYNAGSGLNVSNTLLIENSAADATSALISGDFNANTLRLNGNVAVNTTPSSYKFYSYDNATYSDVAAIYGQHDVTDNYGVGVYGKGGYKGVVAENSSTSGSCYGVYSYAYGSGTGTRYGIYASAYGGSTNWAGYFSGNVYTSGIYSSSDANLKKNITTISSAMSKVNSLRGVYFEWKSSNELPRLKSTQLNNRQEPELKEERPIGQQVGVIAQDVEAVVPEAVITDENGYKAVDYTKLVPLLIEAIKEQQKTITELQNRVAKLEK